MPHIFKDSEGHDWLVEIDVPACKRVHQLVGVNLLSTDVGATLKRLADPITLVDVLYCIVKPQCEEQGLSDEDFGRRMGIDLNVPAELLIEGLIDFFRQTGRKIAAGIVERTINRAKRTVDSLPAGATEAIETMIETEFDKLDEKLSTIGKPSTESPESSASTPTNPE